LPDCGVAFFESVNFLGEFVVDAFLDLAQFCLDRFGFFSFTILQVRVDMFQNRLLDDLTELARVKRLERVKFDCALAKVLLESAGAQLGFLIGILGSP
jgi:hypothetical protein